MTDIDDGMAKLLTQLVDAEAGYREGIQLAELPVMVATLESLRGTHANHIRRLEELMRARGMKVDDSTSAMSVVHRAILNIRSVLSGLDENIVPGLIDGEQRIVKAYDDLIPMVDDTTSQVLQTQRGTLNERIAELEAFKMTGTPLPIVVSSEHGQP